MWVELFTVLAIIALRGYVRLLYCLCETSNQANLYEELDCERTAVKSEDSPFALQHLQLLHIMLAPEYCTVECHTRGHSF